MRTTHYLLLGALLILPVAAAAQGSDTTAFVPLLPQLPGISTLETSTTLAPFLSQIYKICIGAAAVLAVLQLMRAGVMYMGGDSITEKKEARELITLSIVGLILVLSPVIVFSIINPKILNLDINAASLKTEIQNIQAIPGQTTAADGSVSRSVSAGPSSTCTQATCSAVNGEYSEAVCYNASSGSVTAFNSKFCSAGYSRASSCSVAASGCTPATQRVSGPTSSATACPIYTAGQTISGNCVDSCNAQPGFQAQIRPARGQVCNLKPVATTPAAAPTGPARYPRNATTNVANPYDLDQCQLQGCTLNRSGRGASCTCPT